MALGVHNFTDLVNLQTVCKSTDLQVYTSMGTPRGFGDLGRRAIYFQGAGEHC